MVSHALPLAVPLGDSLVRELLARHLVRVRVSVSDRVRVRVRVRVWVRVRVRVRVRLRVRVRVCSASRIESTPPPSAARSRCSTMGT